MARATKPQVRKTIRHSIDAPGAAEAAQIALVLMAVAKEYTWDGVLGHETLHERVELTEQQQSVLEHHAEIRPYLGRGGGDRTARSVIPSR